VHRFCSLGAETDRVNDATRTGEMNGVRFHYYAIPSYRTLVVEHGLVLVDVHHDPGVSTYYLTRKER
jgi:hypothetical protein